MSTLLNTSSTTPFEHSEPKYRCCCNSIHVKNGAKIIGVIQYVCAIFGLIIFIFSQKLNALCGMLEISSILCEITVLLMLLCATKYENPNLLLPYLIYEALMVLTSMTFAISGIIAFIDPNGSVGHIYARLIELSIQISNEYKLNDEIAVKLVAAFTVILFSSASTIYLFNIHVIYKYLKYLQDFNQARKNDDFKLQHIPKINEEA